MSPKGRAAAASALHVPPATALRQQGVLTRLASPPMLRLARRSLTLPRRPTIRRRASACCSLLAQCQSPTARPRGDPGSARDPSAECDLVVTWRVCLNSGLGAAHEAEARAPDPCSVPERLWPDWAFVELLFAPPPGKLARAPGARGLAAHVLVPPSRQACAPTHRSSHAVVAPDLIPHRARLQKPTQLALGPAHPQGRHRVPARPSSAAPRPRRKKLSKKFCGPVDHARPRSTYG